MDDTGARPDRTLLIIVAVIAVLVVTAIVVVFANGGPRLREPGTPERAVQDYATAVIDGDLDAAEDFLSPNWDDDCMGFRVEAQNLRITLINTRESADRATVSVSVSSGYDSGPFGGTYEYEDAFQLERVAGKWLIRSAPWEFAICRGSDDS